jgi:hypothetical protein
MVSTPQHATSFPLHSPPTSQRRRHAVLGAAALAPRQQLPQPRVPSALDTPIDSVSSHSTCVGYVQSQIVWSQGGQGVGGAVRSKERLLDSRFRLSFEVFPGWWMSSDAEGDGEQDVERSE